jgi:hypothetical protein
MNAGQHIHLHSCPPVYFSIGRTVPRYVRCEHCDSNYIYELTRVGVGEAEGMLINKELVASPLAVERAMADLRRELAHGNEAVPCPECYLYQKCMTAEARRIQWGWIRRIGGQALLALPIVTVLAVLMAVVFFPGNTRLAVALASGIAVVLLAAGAITALVFHLTPCRPNQWSESYRRGQAEALACTREEFALASVNGGPFAEDLIAGREHEFAGVLFLWVLPHEIDAEATVTLRLPEGREMQVELSRDDHEGVFLHEDRVVDAGDDEYRICLRVFDTGGGHGHTTESNDNDPRSVSRSPNP